MAHGIETYDLKSPLQTTPFQRGQWNIKSRRTGLIGKKIGIYPMWTSTGERVVTTLIQVAYLCYFSKNVYCRFHRDLRLQNHLMIKI